MLHLTGPDGLPSVVFGELHCRIIILGGHMRRRQFMGLTGGAVAAGPRAVREDPLPDGAAGNSVQKEEQDFPLIIANIASNRQQKAQAVGAALPSVLAADATAPLAST